MRPVEATGAIIAEVSAACYTSFEVSIAKRHLSYHNEQITLDRKGLSESLKTTCPEVMFAYLLGSAVGGKIAVGSDIDIALYTVEKPPLDLYSRVEETVSRFAGGAHCDLGFLKNAEPVYRFEALKGRLLFSRDREIYLRFYSLTCREYESQLADYERQYRYRTIWK